MSSQTINLAPGDWYIIRGKYWQAKYSCALTEPTDAVLAISCELKSQADYEAWLATRSWWATLGERIKRKGA